MVSSTKSLSRRRTNAIENGALQTECISFAELSQKVVEIFTEAQESSTAHRRLAIALKKLHVAGLDLPNAPFSGAEWEKEFFQQFFKALGIVLAIKKHDEVVHKLIKFMITFFYYSYTFEREKNNGANIGDENPHYRLISNMIACLLFGTEAKDKAVRQRVCMLLGGCISSVDELRTNLLEIFLAKLTDRLYDKEHVVRIQAAIAISRLQQLKNIKGNFVWQELVHVLQFDPHCEVRKTVLSVLDVTTNTLSFVVERSRDVSPIVRKFFFKKKFEEIEISMLTPALSEIVLKNGLLDRDVSVRDACIDMLFSYWLPKAQSNLIHFMSGINVLENTEIAIEALKGFFARFKDLFTTFSEDFFESLTNDTALIMRVYCEYVFEVNRDAAAVQELLPELTAFAMHIKNACERLLEAQDDTEESVNLRFQLFQLLMIGKMLDFSDEVGRRFMISLLHDILSVSKCPFLLVPEIVDFLYVLSPQAAERYAVATEIINELHEDNGLGASDLDVPDAMSVHPHAENNEELRFVQQYKSILVLKSFLKALPFLDFASYPPFADIFNQIVISGVNSHIASVQEESLECLGHFCLLNKDLAKEYVGLLGEFYKLGHEEVRIIALRFIVDFVMLFGLEHFESASSSIVPLDVLKSALCEEQESFQTAAVEGCCKLLLSKIVRDRNLLEGLLLLYFHPSSADKVKLRQCLAYFCPSFAFSSNENQVLLREVFVDVLKSVVVFYNVSQKSEDAVKPITAALQMLHWCDAANFVPPKSDSAEDEDASLLINCHGLIAFDLLCRCFIEDSFENIRIFVGILLKLRIDASCDISVIKKIDFLTTRLIKITTDKNITNQLRKFIASIIEFDDRTVCLSTADLDSLKEVIAKGHQIICAADLKKK